MLAQENRPVTQDEKAAARAQILEALDEAGGSVGGDTYRELYSMLRITHMSMKLFKRSLWHLKVGDRDPERLARIAFNEPEKLERFRSMSGHRISIRLL